MPASRPQWKGYLKLSLVSCPIAIYPAVSAAERISFRQINRNTGNRLRQQLVDAVTGEAVDSSDKGRGYEVGDSSFLPVEDEELEAARQQAQARRPGAATVQPPAPSPISEAPLRKPDRAGGRAATPVPSPAPEPPRLVVENTRTIDIERFVPRGQIDARYIEKPYYIAPRDAVGQEAFAVIRDAWSASSSSA
jgi:DNA end-binding protein Ku